MVCGRNLQRPSGSGPFPDHHPRHGACHADALHCVRHGNHILGLATAAVVMIDRGDGARPERMKCAEFAERNALLMPKFQREWDHVLPQPVRKAEAIPQAARSHLEQVRVRVDEARQDDASRSVDQTPGARCGSTLKRPDCRDLVPDDVDESGLDESCPIADSEDRPTLDTNVGRRCLALVA